MQPNFSVQNTFSNKTITIVETTFSFLVEIFSLIHKRGKLLSGAKVEITLPTRFIIAYRCKKLQLKQF